MGSPITVELPTVDDHITQELWNTLGGSHVYTIHVEKENGDIYISQKELTLTDGATLTETPVPANYDPVNEPLTFEVITAGKIKVVNEAANAIQYKKNDDGWTDIAYGTTQIDVAVDDIVKMRGDNTSYYPSYWASKIKCEDGATCKVYGNVMSLVNSTDFANAKILTAEKTFRALFDGNTGLYNHDKKNIVLPATTLTNNCYDAMFNGCSNLTRTPELPATTLAEGCYQNMFQDCSNLTSVAELPAMEMKKNCYNSMFRNCTQLVNAPALPATTLADDCYHFMFTSCSSLKNAPSVLPATVAKNSCYEQMFAYCNTLVTAPEIKATTMDVESCYDMFRDCSNLKNVTTELPAETLAEKCYYQMFYYCTSLEKAPEIKAKTLASECCYSMFNNCTSLKDVQTELPATTIVARCYYQMFYYCTNLQKAPALPALEYDDYTYGYTNMFYGCTNLNYVKCLATSFPNGIYSWLQGAATGTFVVNDALTIIGEDRTTATVSEWGARSTSGDRIPAGWTVIKESEE